MCATKPSGMHSEVTHFFDPKVDIIFRALFTSPKWGQECLLSFINSSLMHGVSSGLKHEMIVEVEVDDANLLPEIVDGKLSILDIKAKDPKGRKYNIEMQVSSLPNMVPRVLYYWSKLYSEELKKGEEYQELTPTISIVLMNWKLSEDDKFHHVYEILERDTHERLIDHMELHFLELVKLQDLQPKDSLLAWLLFFKDPNGPWKADIMKASPGVKRAYDQLGDMENDPKMRTLYELREKSLHDINSLVGAARREGKLEGKLEGRNEALYEIVRKMKASGQNASLISQITGLSLEEILKA